MTRTKSEMDSNKISLTIYSMIVLAVAFAEFMTYDKTSFRQDYFSAAIGLVGWFGIFMHSQRIIDCNSFQQFAFVGLAILVVSAIKQSLTSYILLPLFAAGLPLLFVGFFRLLTFIFYRDYPNTSKRIIIIFGSKYGKASFDGDDIGYKPPMKERIFSLLLFMGFMGFAFVIIWTLTKVLK